MSKIGEKLARLYTHTADNINPMGGLHFVRDAVEKSAAGKVVRRHLGERVKQCKYTFEDILFANVYSIHCEGKRLEDLKKHKKPIFDKIPGLKMPSPDRVGDLFKSMATEKIRYVTSPKITHEFNPNLPLNDMMVDMALKLKVIDSKVSHTIDFDNTIIGAKKCDSKYSYKEMLGYQPAAIFAGMCPLYIENRNGNSNAVYRMEETLTRGFDLLHKKGIQVARFRSDSAAYSKNVIKLLEKRGMEFFIRPKHSRQLSAQCRLAHKWKWVRVRDVNVECCSFDFHPFSGPTKISGGYRIVVKRELHDGKYGYWCIITNNRSMSDAEVIRFYNHRGNFERRFAEMKEDWNWSRLPFSYMNQNTVFLIMTAIGFIIHQHIRPMFNKLPFVKSTYWLKNFIAHFMKLNVTIKDGLIYLHTEKDYGALFGST